MSEIVQPPVKAISVTMEGEPNGFKPSATYRSQVLHGGITRLEISSPGDKLHIIHQPRPHPATYSSLSLDLIPQP